jgi:hypothetical protein
MKLKEILKATGAKDWKEAVARFGFGEQFGLDSDQWFDFIIRLTTPEEIMRIMPLPWQYGNFEGEKLAEILASLMKQGIVMYVEFGRRGSPELHVFMRDPENAREPMMDMLKRFSPDELEEYGPYGIRAWWD